MLLQPRQRLCFAGMTAGTDFIKIFMYIQCIINKMLSKTFLSKNRLTAKYGINPQQTSALFVIN